MLNFTNVKHSLTVLASANISYQQLASAPFSGLSARVAN